MAYNIAELFVNYPVLKKIKAEIVVSLDMLRQTFLKKGTVFVCGNGGSASDADHMAGELLKGFMLSRPVGKDFTRILEASYGEEGRMIASKLQGGMKVICLNGHPAFTSAYSNDVDPEMVFAQQVYVLGEKKDVFVAFTTSGNSPNVVKALKVARAKGMGTLVFTGKCGGESAKLADCAVKVPKEKTHRIQEHHLPIYHALCAALEEEFYGKQS
ncbi:MAG: SIS domain-containing protein [Victivallales bacterium]|nr:SIS domain-containing protein [Victivallales bacterium]